MIIFLLLAIGESYLPILIHNLTNYSLGFIDMGFIPYGQNISGSLAVLSNLCGLQKDQIQEQIILTQITQECTYEEQLRNAEASLLLIFSTYQQPALSHIKTKGCILLIDEQNAKALKKSRDQQVSVIFQTEQSQLPQITYVVQTFNQTTDFMKQIQEFKKNNMKFDLRPIYQIIEYEPKEECEYDIIKSKKICQFIGTFETTYVLFMYKNDKVPIREMLFENLAQICIFQEYGLDKWLNYRIRYIDQCYQSFGDLREIQECKMILIEQEFDNYQSIQTCIIDSFTSNNITNTLLSNQAKLSEALPPTNQGWVGINDQLLWGDYSIRKNISNSQQTLIFQALCESYLDKPAVCIKDFKTSEEDAKNQLFWIIITIVGLIFIASTCLCLIVKKILKQKKYTETQLLSNNQHNAEVELNHVNSADDFK